MHIASKASEQLEVANGLPTTAGVGSRHRLQPADLCLWTCGNSRGQFQRLAGMWVSCMVLWCVLTGLSEGSKHDCIPLQSTTLPHRVSVPLTEMAEWLHKPTLCSNCTVPFQWAVLFLNSLLTNS